MSSRREATRASGRPLPDTEPACYQHRAPVSALHEDPAGPRVGVVLTTGAVVTVDEHAGIDFDMSFEDQQGSNRMWLYALHPLRVLGEAVRAGRTELEPFYRAGWLSAVSRFGSEEGRTTVDSLPSGDHAAATRLRACLEAGPLIDEPELLEAIRDIGDTTVAWLLQDEHYRANNHGLMSSIALLHWSAEVLSDEDAAAVRATAVDRIVSLAGTSFDDRGLCDENTIGYHNFNLRCYDEILGLHESRQLDPRIDSELRPILERATTALSTCLLQDGTVPTIGDTGRYVVRGARPENRSSAFPRSGFGVLKDERLYLSLICGARSEVHKHADDSSMTLWWEGHPMVIDAGSYLYDRTDPYRRAMESSLGHSGIFLDAVDGPLRSEIVRRHSDYWAALEDTGPGPAVGGELRCSYGLGDRARVDRRVATVGGRWIVVRDVVRFREASLDPSATQRWLVGPQLSPTRLGHGHWWFGAHDGSPGLTVIGLGSADEELYAGEEWGRYRGWYSEQYRNRRRATGLDFTGRGRVQVHTTLLAVGDTPVVDRAAIPLAVLEQAHPLVSG